VYLERNANGKTPFKIQVKKPAPKAKAKPRTSSSSAGRGFQTFGEMTADASGAENAPFGPVLYKNDHFAKTGSGQT
jgi:hypothetical protein